MNIEKEIFKRSHIDFQKLEEYGFKKINQIYYYEVSILDNRFHVEIEVDEQEKVQGKVIDAEFKEEYLLLRVDSQTGEFVSKVRDAYKNILKDIREKCSIQEYFIHPQANRITKYIIQKYQSYPEFLWDKDEGAAVFRNKENNKWFGIMMNIKRAKLDLGEGEVEILNVKLQQEEVNEKQSKIGYHQAYHMNHKSWITILLDDTLQDNEIEDCIEKSYQIIDNNKTKTQKEEKK